ncbi:hypothetical protein EI94DRAFT_1716724 [Lactarius quietus]|nr:hypothetical protein EI94DRAFT_1716724 [Lactarius quietus]
MTGGWQPRRHKYPETKPRKCTDVVTREPWPEYGGYEKKSDGSTYDTSRSRKHIFKTEGK